METNNGNPLTWRHLRAGYVRYALPAILVCLVVGFMLPDLGLLWTGLALILGWVIGWYAAKVSLAYANALADHEAAKRIGDDEQ